MAQGAENVAQASTPVAKTYTLVRACSVHGHAHVRQRRAARLRSV